MIKQPHHITSLCSTICTCLKSNRCETRDTPSKQSTFPIVLPRCFPGGSFCWVPIQMLSKPWIEAWNHIRCEVAKRADTPATACLCTQNPWTQTYPCIFWTLYSNWTDWSKQGRNKAGAEPNRSKWHDSHETQKIQKDRTASKQECTICSD